LADSGVIGLDFATGRFAADASSEIGVQMNIDAFTCPSPRSILTTALVAGTTRS
jgi:hypothetical protein